MGSLSCLDLGGRRGCVDPGDEDEDAVEEEGVLKLNFIPGICVKVSWGGIVPC